MKEPKRVWTKGKLLFFFIIIIIVVIPGPYDRSIVSVIMIMKLWIRVRGEVT